jgi:tRNA pseudouridine13 synthase
MKLKETPEDFQVEEITSVRPGEEGSFAFYRLEKRGWNTADALATLRQRWRISPRRLSFAGLKDRHARTIQYLTILHGPRRNLHHQDLTVTYLGQVASPYSSTAITTNAFRLLLRDIPAREEESITGELERLRREGVPNYFDDQRFGSVAGPEGEFIGKLLVRAEFEAALRLALLAPYAHDRQREKQEKALLRAHWGDWAHLRPRLRGQARNVVDHLHRHPADFRGAFLRLRQDLRILYLSVYQSHLWNRMLAHWLTTHCPPEHLRLVPLRLGDVPFPHTLPDPLQQGFSALSLPLPSARMRLSEEDPRWQAIRNVLAEEGMTLKELQVKGVRELFFSRGERAACVLPGNLAYAFGPGRDSEQGTLDLSFALPRGSYATLLVKALSLVGGEKKPVPSTPAKG